MDITNSYTGETEWPFYVAMHVPKLVEMKFPAKRLGSIEMKKGRLSKE